MVNYSWHLLKNEFVSYMNTELKNNHYSCEVCWGMWKSCVAFFENVLPCRQIECVGTYITSLWKETFEFCLWMCVFVCTFNTNEMQTFCASLYRRSLVQILMVRVHYEHNGMEKCHYLDLYYWCLSESTKSYVNIDNHC